MSDIQIVKSNIPTAYEPYGYKIPVKVSGTNIFDTIDGIVISNTNNRLDNYYTGDIVKLNYTLNLNLAITEDDCQVRTQLSLTTSRLFKTSSYI